MIFIDGLYMDGTPFSCDPKWWRETKENVQELRERLEKPMLREFCEEKQRHIESAKKLAMVHVYTWVGEIGNRKLKTIAKWEKTTCK